MTEYVLFLPECHLCTNGCVEDPVSILSENCRETVYKITKQILPDLFIFGSLSRIRILVSRMIVRIRARSSDPQQEMFLLFQRVVAWKEKMVRILYTYSSLTKPNNLSKYYSLDVSAKFKHILHTMKRYMLSNKF